jgi:hypothetical protein
MLSAGLVSRICSNADLIDNALDIATSEAMKKGDVASLATLDETNKIIASRTDVGKYRDLSVEVSRKMARGELVEDRRADNDADGYISKKLNALGRPLAPLAVKAARNLVEKYSNVRSGDLKRAGAMAREEAEMCFTLMNTVDRRTGVNSILSANPLEKIPVFTGS